MRQCHFFSHDTPCKGLPCLYKQVFDPLRFMPDVCHWHAAPFAGDFPGLREVSGI